MTTEVQDGLPYSTLESGFELYSRWVPLKIQKKRFLFQRFVMSIVGLYRVHVTHVQNIARTSGV